MCRLAFLFLPAILALAAAPAEAPRKPEVVGTKVVPPQPGAHFVTQLRKTIDFPGVDDPRKPLSEVLSDLGKSESVTFHINEKAFDKPGSFDPDKILIADLAIPPMKVRLAKVLDVILERVPAKFGATYLIRKDWIEITSQAAVREEVWGKDYRGPFLPLVNLAANETALPVVLNDLANQSARNIVIDPRIGAKVQTLLTASFLNQPLDSALVLLTEMVGLAVVELDATFYVTTRERAAEVKSAWTRFRPATAERAPLPTASAPPSAPGKKVDPLPRAPEIPGHQHADELAAALARTVEFGGIDDPKTTLIEALDQLSKIHRITFGVNERAFRADGNSDVVKNPIADKKMIPPMKTSPSIVLSWVLERVQSKSGATYLVRPDSIEITTLAAAREEVWGKDYRGPFLPLVNVTANHWALDDLLKDVALHSGKNITVDLATGDRGRTPVTTRFLNEPLDTALFLLTDMAGLTFVQLDSAFHVTTAERAAELKAAWAKRRPRE